MIRRLDGLPKGTKKRFLIASDYSRGAREIRRGHLANFPDYNCWSVHISDCREWYINVSLFSV
jgi:hypothetical protein